MAINFEAANMAGYNNPKIEVFKAIGGENNTLSGAPSKSAILDCINRGSVPFIVLTLSGNMTYILPLSTAHTDGEKHSLLFSCLGTASNNQPFFIGVSYNKTNDYPVYAMIPIPISA